MKSVVITGATGMVGKAILLECLDHPQIKKVLVINRSPIKLTHPKLKEVLVSDFTQIEAVKGQLLGYDACFYAMGVSAIGMNEDAYTKITYAPVRAFADLFISLNPDFVFNYVSGAGTDSSEKGNQMWARVKGMTENHILNLGFKDAYMFRAGMIIPERGIKSKTGWYNALYVIFRPLFPLFKKSAQITTTSRVGLAMINSLFYPMKLKHLENKDINVMAAMHLPL